MTFATMMPEFMQGLVPQMVALLEVLVIDLVLAGDNAIVVGMAVAGLAPADRRRAIMVGIGIATVLRIAFAFLTLQLMAIVGLLLAGGLLLLWVCWKMYRELHPTQTMREAAARGEGVAPKSLRQAMIQIVLADVSMSLDNVLAVAGAAREHPAVLAIGLGISVILMGAAATLIANLLERYRWIAWIGLALVFYVSLKLIWEGGHEVAGHLT